ncbi:MAG: hypothetical protein IT304_08025 [Dehalococcoidia bacterium]|nr:hypothetical protein [Dehalococcoidia bacterium]
MTIEPEIEHFRLPDPAMEQYTWLWDAMHTPRPLPPIVAQAFTAYMRASSGGKPAVVNGYLYHGLGAPPAPGAQRPPPLLPELGARALWETECLPRVRALCASLVDAAYAQTTTADLAARMPAWFEISAQAFALTMAPLERLMAPSARLIAFCNRSFGPGSDLLAMTLLQGTTNDSTARGLALGELAESVQHNPELVAAAASGDSAAVARTPGGRPLLDALAAVLDAHGQGNQTWMDFSQPSPAEDPALALRLVGLYARAPEHSPAAAHARAAAARDEAERQALARLPGEELRRELAAILADANAYAPVMEGRANWQVRASGALRTPLLALGGRLVALGSVAEAADVFFLLLEELPAAAHGEAAHPRVAARRAAWERWRQLVPPQTLGAPLPEDASVNPMLAKMFGVTGTNLPTAGPLLRGNPASGGQARGRARVVLELDEALALEEGEVLVCPFTAPAWTPLFSLAAAIVTDAGGVLSHAAITAREYGVPCVAGVREATRTIPDGAVVSVDGTAGTVLVEGA